MAKVTRGSGNVYADLGFRDAEEMQRKSAIVAPIGERLIRIAKGHFHEYSVEQLELIADIVNDPAPSATSATASSAAPSRA